MPSGNARATEAQHAAEGERDAAEAANAAKGQFLASMSHELRTPRNTIGGHVQLLDMGLHGPVTDAQRRALARVHTPQTRLLALINDVLNYAELERGRVDYDVRAVDVAGVVRDVAPLVALQPRSKGLALDVRLPDAPCVVAADRDKLGQVLVNLLSNAIEFTDSPHPHTGAPGLVIIDVTTGTAGDGSAAAGPLGRSRSDELLPMSTPRRRSTGHVADGRFRNGVCAAPSTSRSVVHGTTRNPTAASAPPESSARRVSRPHRPVGRRTGCPRSTALPGGGYRDSPSDM